MSYLSNDFDVVAISSDRYALEQFGNKEGIKTYCIPMKRAISLWDDFGSLIRFLVFSEERVLTLFMEILLKLVFVNGSS